MVTAAPPNEGDLRRETIEGEEENVGDS